MSRQVVMTFYESLVSVARMKVKEHGEKPMFLLAALKCTLENDELKGVSLLDLLHPLNRRKIRRYFNMLTDRRLADSDDSWRAIINPPKKEMLKQIQKFINKETDVSTAFANLTVKEIEDLINVLEKRLESKSEPSRV